MNALVTNRWPQGFASRVAAVSALKSSFCLGVDPSPHVLTAWGLPLEIEGLREFCLRLLEVAIQHVGIVKPQIAYFESFGACGLQILADFMKQARAAGLVVIADAKRGDIGSTMEAYSRAWLGEAAPFSCDAITVSPYLGFGALRPALEQAVLTGTGIFIVVRSSNPEGAYLQGAQVDGEPLADHLAREIAAFNSDCLATNGTGPLGAVIGGTLGSSSERTISLLSNAYYLVPGLGAQGATHADVKAQFSDARARVIPTASRSILMLGRDKEKITSALRRAADETRELTGT